MDDPTEFNNHTFDRLSHAYQFYGLVHDLVCCCYADCGLESLIPSVQHNSQLLLRPLNCNDIDPARGKRQQFPFYCRFNDAWERCRNSEIWIFYWMSSSRWSLFSSTIIIGNATSLKRWNYSVNNFSTSLSMVYKPGNQLSVNWFTRVQIYWNNWKLKNSQTKKLTFCFRWGSNSGPFAPPISCEANVITTTLRKHCRYVYHRWQSAYKRMEINRLGSHSFCSQWKWNKGKNFPWWKSVYWDYDN